MEEVDMLLAKIEEIASSKWNEGHAPILLSNLALELRASDVDYKSIIGTLPLGKFIEQHSSALQLIVHPLQHAKIGVYPIGESYSFDLSEIKEQEGNTPKVMPSISMRSLQSNRKAFINFIEAISDLPKHELDDVVIPAHIIVYLLTGKK